MLMPRFRRPILVALHLLVVALCAASPAFASPPDQGKPAMTVTLVRSDRPDCGADCPEWLAMSGKIGKETPGLLAAALLRLGHRRVSVLVDSPGGVVEAAMAMGRMIRARALDVSVAGTDLTDCPPGDLACIARRRSGERVGYVSPRPAICASACVLILAAGTGRSVGPHSLVGVHQFVTRRTVTRVINTFRVVRRMVRGHLVEVSRTLIASRPVSSRIVQSAASESMYSETDRYLLGMGIAETIMPLMRSALPSSVHWMTDKELTDTRLATDTTGQGTPAAGQAMRVPLASSPLGGRQAGQASTCAINASNLSGGLQGPIAITPSTVAGVGTSFSVEAHLERPAGAEALTLGVPRFCDKAPCDAMGIAGSLRGTAATDYRFEVYPSGVGDFLTAARRSRWLSLPIQQDGQTMGDLRLVLAGDGASAGWRMMCQRPTHLPLSN